MNEVRVWRVQLGKLYYTKGMDTRSYERKGIRSYELTSSSEHSWLFPCEDAADRIASELGGLKIELSCTLEEFVYMRDVAKAYIERKRIKSIFRTNPVAVNL